MAEKALDPAAWKAFARGRSYRDAAFVDALRAWAEAARDAPRLRLDALDELEEAAAEMLDAARDGKNGKQDKGAKDEGALAEWLEDAAAAIDTERKKAVAEQAAAAAEDYDFDNDVQALTSGLVTMLRQLRRGQPTHALLALHGRQCALRLARRPLQAQARELLATWLGASGGVRYVPASCRWESAAVTFVVPVPAAGLARMLRQALLQQTGKRYKVRVCSAEADDVDDVDDVDEAGDDADDEADDDAEDDIDNAGAALADTALLEQRGRLAALAPALRSALLTRRPDARKLRALLVFADDKLRRGQTAAARQALDALALLLGADSPAS